MFDIAIPIIPICFIADTFQTDRLCSDRFHTDTFHTDMFCPVQTYKNAPPPGNLEKAVLRIRIHMFLGLLDPASDPSIIKQK
jgi:hypothetical protein